MLWTYELLYVLRVPIPCVVFEKYTYAKLYQMEISNVIALIWYCAYGDEVFQEAFFMILLRHTQKPWTSIY